MNREFDWNHLRAFLATADTGSLSAAARKLGIAQPTVGRQVSALEEALAVDLFERTTRSLQLTDVGRELVSEARAMADAAARVSLLAHGRAQALDGTIRVTASDMMSTYVLPDTLIQLRSMAPSLRVDVISANDIRDILKREADIAIRHVRPTEPDLIARKISDASAHLYASKSYLAARGMPRSVADLAQHDFISMTDDTAFVAAMAERGLPVTHDNLTAGSTSVVTIWAMVRRGFGMFPMSDAIARQFDDVVPVLEGETDLSFPIWLVTHRELHTSKRIRLVFDLLAEVLAER